MAHFGSPLGMVTLVAGRGTLYPRDCAMTKHFSIKIKDILKGLRGKDDLWYDCLLEQEARRKQENPKHTLDPFYGTVLVKLNKTKDGIITLESLEEAFNSLKEKNGKRLRQIKYKKVSRYGCWGKFYPQIYSLHRVRTEKEVYEKYLLQYIMLWKCCINNGHKTFLE
ncbi:hypothetical protein ANCCAN_25658 [Ancylostoma caninum]|uniref:Uncharacterized protein n=1 Tax=Ancylostoma caninum TaxID=29170 RepID=A0A368FEJ4_ANCCA|nr:hypothetical protein ANCCAN_25658 [Ancylostoma caninum]